MRTLITGGCGFIGGHCVEHFLKNTDWEIVILDSLTYAGNLNRLTDIDVFEKERKRIHYIWHDLKSPINESVSSLIGDVDYIFHLAAESHVDKSLKDPVPFVHNNVVGTCNILEFARSQKGLRLFFNFGTDEEFGPAPEEYKFREGDTWKPSNPYSASKCGQAALGLAYYISFGLPVISTKTMNNFGERQHPEKFIPKTISAILNKEKVIIHGTPGNIGSRTWLHARNTADALLFLTEKGRAGETYNISGNVELNNLEMANKIAVAIPLFGRPLKDDEIEYVDFHKCRPGHDKRYALDGSKIMDLGWKPRVDFDESLNKMVNWSIEHPQWLNVKLVSPYEARRR